MLLSLLCHHKALSRVPSAMQEVLIRYLFPTIAVYICQSQSPNSSYSPYPLDVHVFVLYICVSVSALPIGSSVSFF